MTTNRLIIRAGIRTLASPSAEAYRRDDLNAEVHLYPAGHLALETNGDEIIPEIERFLARVFSKR